MTLRFVKLHPDAFIPEYAFLTDSGFDLRAYAPIEVKYGEIVAIPTGLSVEIDGGNGSTKHHEIQIRPKSGLAANHGITVVNTPGTVDLGYRGELFVIATCLKKDHSHKFAIGDKIAQGVVCEVYRPKIEVVTEHKEKTDRGVGGLGSTGK